MRDAFGAGLHATVSFTMSPGVSNDSTWYGSRLPKLSMSVTAGAQAFVRVCDAAVSQVVHPRFDAPDTTHDFSSVFHSFCQNACSASFAGTTLLTIGKGR